MTDHVVRGSKERALALAIAQVPVLLLRSCSIEITVATDALRCLCWLPTLLTALLLVICVYFTLMQQSESLVRKKHKLLVP